MRRVQAWVLVGLVTAVAGGLPVASAQDDCTYDFEQERIVCRDTGTDGPADDDTPWWATETAQAVVGGVALVGSLAAGAFAVLRVRRRRRTVGAYLSEVEQTYAKSRHTPDDGLERLVALRNEVHERHERGRLEDAPFLQLEARIKRYIGRLRLDAIEERASTLPPGLAALCERLVGDGVLTQADRERILGRARDEGLGDEELAGLVGLLDAWVRDDAPLAPA